MASIIKLKRSSTGGSVPSGGALQAGELAINLADKKLFSSTDGTDIITISGDQYNLITQANTSHGVTGGAADIQLTVDNVALSNDVISLIGSETIAVTRNSNGSISFSASDVPQLFTANTGTATPSNENVNIFAGDSTGIDVTATGSTVTISGTDATTTAKGVASFSDGDFAVTSGVVTIKSAGVGNGQLENDGITISSNTGTPSEVQLGDTLNIVSGDSTGVTVNYASDTVTISGTDATTTSKGVASFPASLFTVTSGAVGILDASTTVKGIAFFNSGDFDVSSGEVTIKDSATGAVTAIQGTANEIEVDRTLGTVTIGIPHDPTLSGNTTLDGYQTTITGNTSIAGDLHVDGDFTVEGSVTYISTSTVNIDDTMLKLAANNVADTSDHGVYAMYVDGATTKYAGYFRDASDSSVFKFYKDLESEPGSTVDVGATGYTLAQVDAVIDGGTF